jgi:acetyl-CoA synthetase
MLAAPARPPPNLERLEHDREPLLEDLRIGQARVYCYVTLMSGQEPSDDLKTELRNWVRTEIGPIASPDKIQFAPGLPKTRSGKIMRRILRKIAEDDFSNLGDTSTLAEPGVVDDLVANRQNRAA